jgi:hypothetical protein
MTPPSSDLSLARSQHGAVMVMGVFMAVILVGIIYYVMGIGETIVYRERMQDAADSGAFAAAVMHARGMNILALLNNIMAAVLSVLVALKVVEDLFAAATIIATAICAGCGPYCGACCNACAPAVVLAAGYEYTASIVEDVEPVVEAIVSATNAIGEGVKVGMPIAAELKVAQLGSETYREPTRIGVLFPASFEDPWLPVEEDDSSLLCEKAGRLAANHANPVVDRSPIEMFLAPATESLAGAFADHYCGDSADKAFKILDDIELGDDRFQLRAVMWGEPPFDRAEARVAVATWGDRDAGVSYASLEELGRLSFAQAEFYYHDDDVDRKEWLWNMRWRARLRRFRLPESLSSVLPDEIRQVGDVVVH